MCVAFHWSKSPSKRDLYWIYCVFTFWDMNQTHTINHFMATQATPNQGPALQCSRYQLIHCVPVQLLIMN